MQEYNDRESLRNQTPNFREVEYRTHILPPRKLCLTSVLYLVKSQLKTILPNMDNATRFDPIHTIAHALTTQRAPRILRHHREAVLPPQYTHIAATRAATRSY